MAALASLTTPGGAIGDTFGGFVIVQVLDAPGGKYRWQVSEVNERTQRTSLLRGPVTDIPGLTTYLAATYLPLAGGTMAGDLDMDSYRLLNALSINAVVIDAESIDATTSLTIDSLPVATEAYASNASNLASGTVPDARLSANVPLKNAGNTFTAAQSIQGIITSDNASGGLHIVNSGMRVVKNGATLLIENQSTGWPLDLSHPLNGFTNVVAAQGGLPTLGFSLTHSNNNPDVRVVRNATGPTLETRAAGGARICNQDGSALAALACGNVTASLGNGGFVGGGLVVGFAGVSTALLAGGQIQVWAAGVQKEAIVATQGINIASDVAIRVSTTTSSQGSVGTTLSVASAGVWQMGTTSNNALGSLNLANLTASGVFTTDFGGGIDLQTQAANYRIGHRVSGTFRTGFDYYHLNVHSSYLVRWSNSSTNITTMDTTLSRASAGVLQVGNAPGANALGSLLLANLTASGTVHGTFLPTQYTVATLPSAAANTGRTVQVTDSSVDFPGNIGNTVAGGGANNVDVKSNGTNWRITG